MDIAETFHGGGSLASGNRTVLLWSAEAPHLYILTLELNVGNNKQAVQVESCQVTVVVSP